MNRTVRMIERPFWVTDWMTYLRSSLRWITSSRWYWRWWSVTFMPFWAFCSGDTSLFWRTNLSVRQWLSVLLPYSLSGLFRMGNPNFSREIWSLLIDWIGIGLKTKIGWGMEEELVIFWNRPNGTIMIERLGLFTIRVSSLLWLSFCWISFSVSLSILLEVRLIFLSLLSLNWSFDVGKNFDSLNRVAKWQSRDSRWYGE